MPRAIAPWDLERHTTRSRQAAKGSIAGADIEAEVPFDGKAGAALYQREDGPLTSSKQGMIRNELQDPKLSSSASSYHTSLEEQVRPPGISHKHPAVAHHDSQAPKDNVEHHDVASNENANQIRGTLLPVQTTIPKVENWLQSQRPSASQMTCILSDEDPQLLPGLIGHDECTSVQATGHHPVIPPQSFADKEMGSPQHTSGTPVPLTASNLLGLQPDLSEKELYRRRMASVQFGESAGSVQPQAPPPIQTLSRGQLKHMRKLANLKRRFEPRQGTALDPNGANNEAFERAKAEAMTLARQDGIDFNQRLGRMNRKAVRRLEKNQLAAGNARVGKEKDKEGISVKLPYKDDCQWSRPLFPSSLQHWPNAR